MPNKFSIVPSQVVEQIVRTTLEGTKTIYSVHVPGLDERLELDDFEGKIFKNIDDVRIYMMENAQKSIESLVSNCLQVVSENFSTPNQNLNLKTVQPNEEDSSLVKVDLGNGQVGRIKVDEDFSPTENLKKNVTSPKRKRGRPRKKESSK
tara:strand:+ start:137 stop:586 length:450 start_codon:yes stop_codon:yes gene_type:complete